MFELNGLRWNQFSINFRASLFFEKNELNFAHTVRSFFFYRRIYAQARVIKKLEPSTQLNSVPSIMIDEMSKINNNRYIFHCQRTFIKTNNEYTCTGICSIQARSQRGAGRGKCPSSKDVCLTKENFQIYEREKRGQFCLIFTLPLPQHFALNTALIVLHKKIIIIKTQYQQNKIKIKRQ